MEKIVYIDKYLEAKIKIPKEKYTKSIEYIMRVLLCELNGDIDNIIENPDAFEKIASSHQKRLEELKQKQ